MIHIEMSQEEFDNLSRDAARYRHLREGQENLHIIHWSEEEGESISGKWMDFVVDRDIEDSK